MRRRALLLVVSMAGVVACGTNGPEPPKDRPRHPLLDNLKPPPLNRPVAAAPLPVGAASLPAGNTPALLLLKDGRPFQGAVTSQGRITTRADRIEFASEGRGPIQILYRLTQGLSPIPEGEASGHVTLVERSSPAGPDRLVLVRSDRSLLLAHLWMKSASLVSAELGDGLTLVQESRLAASPDPAAALHVAVRDGDQSVATIPWKKPTRVKTRVGMFDVLVEANRRTYPSERNGHGYLLKAWVVRAEP